jgi:beta-glucosidase
MEDIYKTIQEMTLEEKASLCSGLDMWHLKSIERLGIPSIMVTDGPHGLRKQRDATGDLQSIAMAIPATCFPTASALAASWNRDLIDQVGRALGEECRQEKVSVILGPGVNIKRSPLCGRNFEYYSEDPYLTGEMAKSFINGVQSQGVGTSIKHYAANNQETRRMTIDTLVDERTLREIYLTGFEIAVKGSQPWTVMCSYNRINGVYASDHAYLMNDILKEEWGHEGLVLTDWGAMNERVTALKAGVELETPGVKNGNDEMIAAAVRSGELPEQVLDRAVARILDLICKAQPALVQEFTYDPDAHHALARQAAGEGAVLLKNDGGLLPLQPGARIALLGRFARQPRYQGAGSSIITPTRLDNLYDELAKLVGDDYLSYAPGYTEKGETDENLLQEALAAAAQADAIVICAGLTDMYEIEGLDRLHMNLPAGHDALIERIAAVHHNVIVVLSNGSPVAMPWADAVPAILEGYLGGQAGAGALADILTGRVNPSGKLAETFPLKFEDTPAQPYPGGPVRVEYREGIYVGYRYYDTAGVDVLFPFGHGLSYTTFDYRDLELAQTGDTVTARFKVKNTGTMPGKEVVQLYVRVLQPTVYRPDKELKGFYKVSLAPGEETEVAITLDQRAFAFYDAGSQDWVVEAGDYEILAGASSRDIRLTAPLQLTQGHGTVTPVDREKLAAYYNVSKERRFSLADFGALYGQPLPAEENLKKGSYTLNTPICDMTDSLVARQFNKAMIKQADKMIKDGEENPMGAMMRAMMKEMPLRPMLMFGSVFNRPKLEALLLMMNGRIIPGLLAMLRGNKQK